MTNNPELPNKSEQELGRRYTGAEMGALIAHAIETGALVIPDEEAPRYTTEEVAEKLGIQLKNDYKDL